MIRGRFLRAGRFHVGYDLHDGRSFFGHGASTLPDQLNDEAGADQVLVTPFGDATGLEMALVGADVGSAQGADTPAAVHQILPSMTQEKEQS